MGGLSQEQINIDLFDEVKRLQGIIYELENKLNARQSPWISVKEKMPEDGQQVLIFTNNLSDKKCSRVQRAYYHTNGERCWFRVYPMAWKEFYDSTKNYVGSDLEGDKIQVTHWMPIPELPEGV